MRARLLSFCCVLGVLWIAGCADEAPPAVDVGDCAGGCDPGAVCVEGRCEPLGEPDQGEEDAPDLVGDVDDQGGEPDEGEPDGVEPDEGEPDMGLEFGAPCDSDDDCGGGICIEVVGGQRICTDFCSGPDSCPEGFSCTFLENSGADGVFLCAPGSLFLCKTCEADAECGGLSDQCVAYGSGQRFCGQDCSGESCPEGFDCLEVPGQGEPTFQCVDTARSCCKPDNGGVERCDFVDNDCDGQVDEDFDLNGDPQHCGACNRACALSNAEAACVNGACRVGACAPGFFNIDNDPDNGCEYACVRNGDELCDGQDNDCDGLVDEDFDLLRSVQHCGACDNPCVIVNGVGACVDGLCARASCDAPFGDCDEDPAVCETDLSGDPNNCGACGYSCAEDWPGAANALTLCQDQACARVGCAEGYEDCNGLNEDGCEVDLRVSLEHCQGCGNECDVPGAVSQCGANGCEVVGCQEGYYDLNGAAEDGCEYLCPVSPAQAEDLPDDQGVDSDCDGVDGDVARSVFLRPDGDDQNSGLTPSAPVATLGRALAVLNGTPGRGAVLVATGTYNLGATVNLPGGVSLHGGYAPDFRARNQSRATLSSSAAVGFRVLSANAPVLIEQIDLSVASRSNPGEAAIGIYVRESGERLRLRKSNLTVGRGADGSAGAAGSMGGDGGNGTNGASGSAGGAAGSGGSGGGGNGGAGRREGPGNRGQDGAANSAVGGGGGAGNGQNLGCNDGDPQRGATGGNGQRGAAGSPGAGGNGEGVLAGGVWSASGGGAGGSGGRGGGGGGGGAGGGEDCQLCAFGLCSCIFCGTGGGGGGGGGGGAGGTGGGGGGGGGASIGIILDRSTVTLEQVVLTTQGGGNGGPGGGGGGGGGGGAAGLGGGPESDVGGPGANGGAGGPGGAGGVGGGGGGGPSVGVWGLVGAVVRQVNGSVTWQIGQGGNGGNGGNNGARGLSEMTRDVQLQ